MKKKKETVLLCVKNLSLFLTSSDRPLSNRPLSNRPLSNRPLSNRPLSDRPLVDQICFEIDRGETLALVGESGGGKSLLAQALMGLTRYKPYLRVEGSILFEGKELLGKRSFWKTPLAYIPQHGVQALNPVFTVGQQLQETALHHGTLDQERAYGDSVAMLKKMKIEQAEQCMRDYPHQLSGGMYQRVLIAMALLTRPSLLIADEPTTALDLSVQGEILDFFHEIQEERGLAILLISHDLAIVSRYADQLMVIHSSKIVEKGICSNLLEKPEHPYTQALFSSRPKWEPKAP